MKHRAFYVCLLFAGALTGAFTGCIKNDIPYARVPVNITAFTVSGQIGETVIDSAKREVTVEIDETTDIRNLLIESFTMSHEATVAPGLKAGDVVNMVAPAKYTLTLYQDYLWTITVNQTIPRYIVAEGQVGDAVISADPIAGRYGAIVYLSKNWPLTDVDITSIKLGPPGSTITPDPAAVTDFTEPVVFTVDHHGVEETWTVEVRLSDTDVMTGEAAPWATFATLGGSFLATGGAKPAFEYRKSSEPSWIAVPESEVTVSGNNFSARLTGLEPATEYTFRSTLDGIAAPSKTFTTEAAPQAYNMGFELWYLNARTALRHDWYANEDITPANYWWDSGNKGANTLADINPTRPEPEPGAGSGFVVSGTAAKLQSSEVNVFIMKIFASASLFSGEFVNAVVSGGSTGARLNFGRPYTGRPTKLTGYYCYLPQVINYAKEPHLDSIGKTDNCTIWVMLTDWDGPFEANTATATFIDRENDPGIIAYGELLSNRTMTAYEPFEIELVYRDLTRKPKYLVIVAAASALGDYFTGAVGSILYIDEFQFTFDDFPVTR